MAGVKGSRMFPLKVAAGEEVTLNVSGEFVYVLECDQPSFLMAMDESGLDYAKIRTYVRVEQGAEYRSLRISNPNAGALNLKVIAGFGEYSDDEVLIGGSITVSNFPPTTAATFSTAAVPVGVAAVSVIAANAARKSVTIQNNGTAEIELGGAAVAVGAGLIVAGGTAYTLDKTTAEIFAISGTDGQDVRVLEEA